MYFAFAFLDFCLFFLKLLSSSLFPFLISFSFVFPVSSTGQQREFSANPGIKSYLVNKSRGQKSWLFKQARIQENYVSTNPGVKKVSFSTNPGVNFEVGKRFVGQNRVNQDEQTMEFLFSGEIFPTCVKIFPKTSGKANFCKKHACLTQTFVMLMWIGKHKG